MIEWRHIPYDPSFPAGGTTSNPIVNVLACVSSEWRLHSVVPVDARLSVAVFVREPGELALGIDPAGFLGLPGG